MSLVQATVSLNFEAVSHTILGKHWVAPTDLYYVCSVGCWVYRTSEWASDRAPVGLVVLAIVVEILHKDFQVALGIVYV